MLEIAQPNDDDRVLLLTGDLDIETTPVLLDRAEPLVDDDGDVILDLSEVTFIDSQGVRGFIRIARALEGRGRLVLTHPRPEVRTLFEIVRVNDLPNIAVES